MYIDCNPVNDVTISLFVILSLVYFLKMEKPNLNLLNKKTVMKQPFPVNPLFLAEELVILRMIIYYGWSTPTVLGGFSSSRFPSSSGAPHTPTGVCSVLSSR